MIFQNKSAFKGIKVLAFAFLVYLIIFLLSGYFKNIKKCYDKISDIECNLHKLEKDADLILKNIADKLQNSPESNPFNKNDFNNLFYNKGISINAYFNDTLIYWTDNLVPSEAVINSDTKDVNSLVYLKNGYYELRTYEKTPWTIYAYILIKSDYRYQNEYLSNSFNKYLDIPFNAEFKSIPDKINIKSDEGNFLFSVVVPENINYTENESIVIFALYILFYSLILYALFLLMNAIHFLRNSGNVFSIIYIIILILIRYVSFICKIPFSLSDSLIFSPEIFATSIVFPSLGDLFLSVLTLTFISFVIYKKINIKTNSKLINCIYVTFSYVLFFLLFLFLSYIIKSLVLNSNIPLNLNNIFNLNTYSVLSFLIIALLISLIIIIGLKIIKFIKIYKIRNVLIFFFAIIISTFIINCFLNIISIQGLIAFSLIYIFLLFIYKKDSKINVPIIFIIMALFSAYATIMLSQNHELKEKEKRKLLAIKLAKEKDPVAEYLFDDIAKKIVTDSEIIDLLKLYPQREKRILYKISNKYFKKYWVNFNVQFTLCNKSDKLNIQPNSVEVNCREFFNSLTANSVPSTISENLNYVSYGNGDKGYLGIIPFVINFDENNIDTLNLFVEFTHKFILKGLGLPELLLDKNSGVNSDLSDYSYALYKSDLLVENYGNYIYPVSFDVFDTIIDENSFININDYNHYFYFVDSDKNIIISRGIDNFFSIIAPFSYLFILLIIIVFLEVFLIDYNYRKQRIKLNFRGRLQLSVVLIIIISFAVIGISSVYYIVRLDDKKNNDALAEKAHSIIVELQHNFSEREHLTKNMYRELIVQLRKFYNVFFTDINIFAVNGELLSTTRRELYEEGLVSKRINPAAYYELTYKSNSRLIVNESIGEMEFLSAYVPLRNTQNKVIAYVNLPYFARQNEIEHDITTFITAFINIFIFLAGLAVVLALVISKYVTMPLQIIKNKIGSIKLGHKNEKIKWERDDEIGSLIFEYNRLTDELEKSAVLLARSERESAWREMAQQVAHEIKNPLTPMKLSVQYFRKAWSEKTSDLDKRIDAFTKTLIEQIDTLSEIASEFSDFAKMPQPKNEIIKLVDIIENTVDLYGGIDNISFEFNYDKNLNYNIFADKKQILRVFNNLINNSVQAIDNEKNGAIKISLFKADGFNVITINDNGNGIPEEQKDKVFIPNFSTKTGGMGLGLAIVKSIIEGANGTINFESDEAKGTTFIVKLPEIIKTNNI